MDSIEIILGENGTGKTRYLVNYYNENINHEDIAVLSNSQMDPFPVERRNHGRDYALNPRNRFRSVYFRKIINGYFIQFILSDRNRDIFNILDFMGFDNRIIIKKLNLFRIIQSYDSGRGIMVSQLVLSEHGIKYYGPKFSGHRRLPVSLTEGFVEKYAHVFSGDQNIYFDLRTEHAVKQALTDISDKERELGNVLGEHFENIHFYATQIMVSKKGEIFPVTDASSGELYIMCLGFFIRRFLDKEIKGFRKKTLLIDEPENSLHPKWQREYISFLRGFISYDSVRVIIATHSPLIASANENYSFSLLGIENAQRVRIRHRDRDTNIEQIYYELFGILTPKNRYLSDYCNEILRNFSEGNSNYNDAVNVLRSMHTVAADTRQKHFLTGVMELLKDLKGGQHG